jgi:toxin ParE1/3/4
MRVRYSKRAVADLIGIAGYIGEHNPRAAQAVEKRIRASVDRLGKLPFIGRPTSDPSMRLLPIARYPYLVFYEVLEGEVVVHHIRHTRRQPVDPGDVRSQ